MTKHFPRGLYVNCGQCGRSVLSVDKYIFPTNVSFHPIPGIQELCPRIKTEEVYLCAECLTPVANAIYQAIMTVVRGQPRKTLGYE